MKSAKELISYCDEIEFMIKRFGNDQNTFESDNAYQLATGMCILQIGELVNRLSDEALTENVQVPWRLIRAMRNVYAHAYDRTKPATVWQTITEDIPALRTQLQGILEKAGNAIEEQ